MPQRAVTAYYSVLIFSFGLTFWTPPTATMNNNRIRNPYAKFKKAATTTVYRPSPKMGITSKPGEPEDLYGGLRDDEIAPELYLDPYDGLRDDEISPTLYLAPTETETAIVSASKSVTSLPKPTIRMINPYKKKKKPYAVFNKHISKDGMPVVEPKVIKKNPIMIITHCKDTGVKKGQCRMSNPNGFWRLSGDRILVPLPKECGYWKFIVKKDVTTVGKIDLKRMMIELHLMKFFFHSGQCGIHYYCRDKREYFRVIYELLKEVEWEDRRRDDLRLSGFLTSDVTEDMLHKASFNQFWDEIISRMCDRAIQRYNIPGRPTRVLEPTVFCVGGYLVQYQKCVRNNTNNLNQTIGLCESEEINWNERKLRGQLSIFQYTAPKNNDPGHVS